MGPEIPSLVSTSSENRVAIQDLNSRVKSSLSVASRSVRKRVVESLTSICRREASAAMDTIVKIMKDPGAKPGERLKAAEMIIERGFGKIPEKLEIARALPDEQLRCLAEKLLERRCQLVEKNETIIEAELDEEDSK
jgi:hypothetical protein